MFENIPVFTWRDKRSTINAGAADGLTETRTECLPNVGVELCRGVHVVKQHEMWVLQTNMATERQFWNKMYTEWHRSHVTLEATCWTSSGKWLLCLPLCLCTVWLESHFTIERSCKTSSVSCLLCSRLYEGCPESIRPFWISREPVAWHSCNLAASQRRPYCVSVNSHSPVGLVSR